MTADRSSKAPYRRMVTSRAIAAIPVNYALTSIATALLARLLPMPPADASIAATLLSFLIFAIIALAIFSARSAKRVWAMMLGAILLLGGALWFSILTGGRL